MRGRVLIADDELSLLKCVAAFLEAKDFEVQAVPSAATAIAALDSGEFDVVLTDMAMETQTAGYDVARAAQSQSYEPDVVVFTSSYIAASEWKEQGVKKLFTKGDVEIATLSNAISNIMDERTRRRALVSTGMN
jgi:DNA-binding NtrC family response regulator